MKIYPECVSFSTTHVLFNVTVYYDGDIVGKANVIVDNSMNIDYVDNLPMNFFIGNKDIIEKIKFACKERARFIFKS